MNTNGTGSRCPLCGIPAEPAVLQEAGWLAPEAVIKLQEAHPWWTTSDGACAACLQHAVLETLRWGGDAALHEVIQSVWPLDAEDAYGALPTPLRMHADPRFSGRGVTLAMVDAGFYPHADLVRPSNRVRVWVDAGREAVRECWGSTEWPGWNDGAAFQWHGLMTSVVAAGNGWSSHGLYAGIASEVDLALVQVRDPVDGSITNDSIARALGWLLEHRQELNLRVVNLSVSGDAAPAGNPVDIAVQKLMEAGVVVVAAAGNDGVRRVVPPASSPSTITAGGLDDQNVLHHELAALWHSNYGEGGKPELVAPSLWVVAPLLPGSRQAEEARRLFELRRRGKGEADAEIRDRKLVRPEYQLVEGTSFAAPIVAGIACAMLQTNPGLTPLQVRRLLLQACSPVTGASRDRQGAGAVDAGIAVALAASGLGTRLFVYRCSPHVREVDVAGGWNGWRRPYQAGRRLRPGVWAAPHPNTAANERHSYKFVIDGGNKWQADPVNPLMEPDGFGGVNSVLEVAE